VLAQLDRLYGQSGSATHELGAEGQIAQSWLDHLPAGDRDRIGAALAALPSDLARRCVYNFALNETVDFQPVQSVLAMARYAGAMSDDELRDYSSITPATPRGIALRNAVNIAVHNLGIGLDEVPLMPGASYARVEAEAIAPYVAKALTRGWLPLPQEMTPPLSGRPGTVAPSSGVWLEGHDVVPLGVDVPTGVPGVQVDLGQEWSPDYGTSEDWHAGYIRVRDGAGERWYLASDVTAAVRGAENPGTPAALEWHAREIGWSLKSKNAREQMPMPLAAPPAGSDQRAAMPIPCDAFLATPNGKPGEGLPLLYVIDGAEYVRITRFAPRGLAAPAPDLLGLPPTPDDRWYPASAFWQPP
jgi:hypothetical protein